MYPEGRVILCPFRVRFIIRKMVMQYQACIRRQDKAVFADSVWENA